MAIRKNIHNLPQGLPNPGFMQEKVQKGDFLKKTSAASFFCCLKTYTSSVRVVLYQVLLVTQMDTYAVAQYCCVHSMSNSFSNAFN
jgi:hypothetical protein